MRIIAKHHNSAAKDSPTNRNVVRHFYDLMFIEKMKPISPDDDKV